MRDILVNGDGRVLLIYASDAGYIDLISAFADKVTSGGNADNGNVE